MNGTHNNTVSTTCDESVCIAIFHCKHILQACAADIQGQRDEGENATILNHKSKQRSLESPCFLRDAALLAIVGLRDWERKRLSPLLI